MRHSFCLETCCNQEPFTGHGNVCEECTPACWEAGTTSTSVPHPHVQRSVKVNLPAACWEAVAVFTCVPSGQCKQGLGALHEQWQQHVKSLFGRPALLQPHNTH